MPMQCSKDQINMMIRTQRKCPGAVAYVPDGEIRAGSSLTLNDSLGSYRIFVLYACTQNAWYLNTRDSTIYFTTNADDTYKFFSATRADAYIVGLQNSVASAEFARVVLEFSIGILVAGPAVAGGGL